MNSTPDVEQLLRWRLTRAENDAPPAPRAARLIELSRPWWERWPEQYRAVAGRLTLLQVGLGHAMDEPQASRSGFPVAALIVRVREELATSVRILYFNAQGRRLRLRFEIETLTDPVEPRFDATFVSASGEGAPLFSTTAESSTNREFRIDSDLPDTLVSEWRALKATDRMPFRLILRPPAG